MKPDTVFDRYIDNEMKLSQLIDQSEKAKILLEATKELIKGSVQSSDLAIFVEADEGYNKLVQEIVKTEAEKQELTHEIFRFFDEHKEVEEVIVPLGSRLIIITILGSEVQYFSLEAPNEN